MRKIRKKFAVIGDPVGHSLSPSMHNAAFRALKLPYDYSRIHLKRSDLSKFFKNLKPKDWAGLNITVPHKEKVLPFLKGLSPDARLIGAANTLTWNSKGLIGFNTDGAGYLRSLKEETALSPRGKNAVVLGAGAAARAILAALCQGGVRRLTIANRTLSRARALQKEFLKKFPKIHIEACHLKFESLKEPFQKAHLLINTTSGGMKGGSSLPSLPLPSLPAHTVVSDIVYRPLKTPLLGRAEKMGLKTHGGLGMLLHQGALAFEIWTRKKAPLKTMRRALLSALKKQRKIHPRPG